MKRGLKISLIVVPLIILILMAIIFTKSNETGPSDESKKFEAESYVSERNLSGMILPLSYENMSNNSRGFGVYGAQIGAHPHGHPGFDFESEVGKPMFAADDGKVMGVEEMTSYQEQSIIVASGTFSDYNIYYTGEIQDIQVKEGDIVKQGDIIGYFKETKFNGLAVVGGIHFEVHKKGVDQGGAVCPYDFMTQEAKKQLDELLNKTEYSDRDKFPLMCNPCPEGGCY